MDPAEALVKVRFVRNVSVNSRLKAVAFNWNRDGKWDVFLATGERVEKLTGGRDSYLEPEISPQGDVIAYLKDRDGDENFQVILRDLASGREEDVTKSSQHYHFSPTFSPDGSKIAFTSNRGGLPSQLFVIEDGKLRELTRWREPITSFSWASRNEIVYTRGIYNTELRLLDLDGRDELLLHFEGSDTYVSDAREGRALFISNVNGWNDVGEVDLRSREVSWIYRDETEKGPARYAQEGILVLRYRAGRNELVKVEGGRAEVVEGNVEEFDIDKDLLALVKSSSTVPSALYLNGEKLVDTTPQLPLVSAEITRYRSFDGLEIEAVVFRPKSWNGDAVIYIHGGPDAHMYDAWCPLCQLLAMDGFLVIAPNYRGSTGYGKRFLHLNDKDLGGGDMRDVVSAARLARSMGARRVFAAGGSYGGYLTALAMVKEPAEWDGGIAIVGFYNWYTEYEKEADYLKAYDDMKMDPSLFRDRSPIFHLEKLSAPILFLHGANDPRCPVEEVKQMAQELDKMGKRYELKIYEDEGHGIRRDENRIDMYRRILSFLRALREQG
ncbi:MAG: S9 family peptidase [Acidilobaceae archaeon]|nr:S9 family peptidase [Acidilobaceae archaeon]MCX8165358.1 S9 family peptidase [Acidilobaceae archaeon]MDW7973784.1 S9 family peptidase [Sulfolobales archaeon]